MEDYLPILIPVGVVAVIAVVWLIAAFNGLVRVRNAIRESWADVDTELKRRYDLIPNLVEVVKGYASHEREVLTAVTEARARAVASTGSPVSQAVDERQLVTQLRQLLAVSERYPDLKANEQFGKLMAQLGETEDRIQAARRFYNGNVRDFNNRVESFPSNLVARVFGFAAEEFFQIEEVVQRQAPAVVL